MLRPNIQDLKSSVVVFLVALPLCLGIALASGAPLASGLISGIIGGIVVGLFSDSHISVSGPAAGLTVIVAAGLNQMGGIENFGIAVLVAGVMQIIFAALRGGQIGDYFPTAVIKGMLAAIGLILISKQLPNALGMKDLFSFSEFHLGSGVISVISISTLLLWEKLASAGKKFFKLVPGPLVAVISSVVLNQLFDLVPKNALVELPTALFSLPHVPPLSKLNFSTLQLALTIALVASLESLLSIDAAEKIDPAKRRTNKNRELLAQGLGNFLSGILGGLPLTAVIVRTSANVQAGAQSKFSAIFHGFWLLLCVLLIPGILNMIPLATLACVLLVVGYKLTSPALYKEMSQRGWEQFLVFGITVGTIMTTDLLKGIFVGFGIALILDFIRPATSFIEVVHEDDKVHLKFVRNVSFLHKSKITKLLNELKEKQEIHFHGMELVHVHIDIHEMLRNYHQEAQKNNKKVFFK